MKAGQRNERRHARARLPAAAPPALHQPTFLPTAHTAPSQTPTITSLRCPLPTTPTAPLHPTAHREELRVLHGPHHHLLDQVLGQLLPRNVVPVCTAAGGGTQVRTRRLYTCLPTSTLPWLLLMASSSEAGGGGPRRISLEAHERSQTATDHLHKRAPALPPSSPSCPPLSMTSLHTFSMSRGSSLARASGRASPGAAQDGGHDAREW